jgi:hypothetical protein
MRPLLIACSMMFPLAAGPAADAASGGRPPREVPSEKAPKELLKRGADYLQQCMQDWEPATHMTKQEWRRTCERVARERLKFLLEQAKENEKK